MTEQEVLDIINSIPVVYWDDDIVEGRNVIYIATILDDEINRGKLRSIGYTDTDLDNFVSYRKGEIDLTHFVWDHAKSFDGDQFYLEVADE